MSRNPPSQEQEIESGALRRSAWLYLFMALLGLGFAYVAESDAILLDGIYSFISLLMTFVAQRVSRLVQTPYTDRFHFGFAHFEPLLNVVRILLILAIATFAAAAAVIALLDGGRPLNAGSAVIYGVVAASGCLAMAWVLIEVINRRAFGWQMDVTIVPADLFAALSLAVGAALIAGIYPAWRAASARPALAMREE